MIERKNVITFGGTPVTLVGSELKVGQKAPDFKVIDNDLQERSLKDYEGKIKIFSIVPSLDTGVCDAQTRWFNQEASQLSDDVVILTISMDLPFAQKRWCGAAGVDRVTTLSDYRYADFGEKYGYLIKELRLLARGIVVADKNDKVVYTETVPEVTHAVNFDAVVAAVKGLLK